MGKTKELANNTIILLIGKIFTQFLSFFLLPLYTHLLPVSDYGLVDLLLTYITLFAPVVTIQQEMATFRFLIDAREDEDRKSSIISTSLASCVKRSLIFVVPCLTIAMITQWHYLALVAIAGAATIMSNLLLQIARGLGKNAKYSVASVITGVATISSNLLLICAFHVGAESILISMAIANAGCCMFLAISLGISAYFKVSRIDDSLRMKMFKFSWPLVPNSISYWLINASDRSIVSAILGTAANGIYTVALKFPSMVGSLLSITVMSWTESASVHIKDDDRDEFFSDVASLFIKAFSSLGILIIAAMPFIFEIVIGEDYRSAYEYIPAAMLGVLLSCIVGFYSAIYVAKKMTKQVASISAVSAIINIVVDLGLIKVIGLHAALISTIVAYAAMLLYRHKDIKKYMNIKYRASDIILAILGFVIVSVLYYLGNFYGFIAGAVFAMLYAIIMNRRIVGKVTKKIICKR